MTIRLPLVILISSFYLLTFLYNLTVGTIFTFLNPLAELDL